MYANICEKSFGQESIKLYNFFFRHFKFSMWCWAFLSDRAWPGATPQTRLFLSDKFLLFFEFLRRFNAL